MRSVALLVVATASVSIALCSCDKPSVVVPKSCCPSVDNTVHQVVVAPETATVKIGDRVQLAASVDAGPGVTVRSVVWSTSDTTVATVSQAGLVTPAGATGVVTVTAKATADPNMSGKSTITVKAATATPQR